MIILYRYIHINIIHITTLLLESTWYMWHSTPLLNYQLHGLNKRQIPNPKNFKQKEKTIREKSIEEKIVPSLPSISETSTIWAFSTVSAFLCEMISEIWLHELYSRFYIYAVKGLCLFYMYVIPCLKNLQKGKI